MCYDKSMKISVYRVDFLPDTTMWNENFQKAKNPWLRLYTDDIAVVNQFPHLSKVEGPTQEDSWFGQDFTIKVDHLIVDDGVVDEEVFQFRRDYGIEAYEDHEQNPEYQPKKRYQWMVGEPTDVVVGVIEERIASWDGV